MNNSQMLKTMGMLIYGVALSIYYHNMSIVFALFGLTYFI